MEKDNHTHVIILAGGKGTRMKSETPKCLTLLGEETFLSRVLRAAEPICKEPTIVIGYKADEVRQSIGENHDFVLQEEQKGTGHAVLCTKDRLKIRDLDTIVVLMGDQPLITSTTLAELVQIHKDRGAAVTVTTVVVPNFENEFAPFLRFGRIIRNAHDLVDRDVEYKDATEEEREIKEVNIGTYAFDAEFLWSHIENLSDKNASGEYYLTDLVHAACGEGKKVVPYVLPAIEEAFGVNSLEDLEIAKRYI